MKFGLPDNTIEAIQKVFESNTKIDEAILFGSRAKGNFRPGSDIDLALKGKNISPDDISGLNLKLDELDLPYEIDLLNYSAIGDKEIIEHIERVGIVFYERWKKLKWGDIAKLEYGKGLKDYLHNIGKYPVYGTNGKIGTTDKSLCASPSVVIGRKGAYRGVHYSSTPFYVIDTAFYLKPKDNGLNLKFAYYQLLTQDINSMDSGSAIPSTSREDFYNLDVKLPPLKEQTTIASILGSLDDKIDLLLTQNKTLEEITQAIFRQWFVKEAEDNWEIKKLGDIVSVKGGTTPSTGNPEFWDGDIHWTSPRDLSKNVSAFLLDTDKKITQKGLEQIGSGLLPVGSVLLSSRAPIGYLVITDISVAINQGYIGIICNKPPISNYFMYLWLTYNMGSIISAANGSVFLEISKSTFKELDFTFPPKQKLSLFEERIEPLFQKIKLNLYQINALTKIRDNLLPKLMSGEIRVSMNESVTINK